MKLDLHMKSTTFLFFVISLVILAVVHNLATAFYLYWHYLWLDIPMHFLGGLVVALGFLTVFRLHERWSFMRGMIITVVVVMVVGVLWELFEYRAGVLTEEYLFRDTVLDFIMDFAGGIAGFLFAYALRPLDTKPIS